MTQGDASSKIGFGRAGFLIDSWSTFVSQVKKQATEFVPMRFGSPENTASIESPGYSSWSGGDWKLNLQKQMDCWGDNRSWVDHAPDIKVTIPKGCLSFLNLTVDVGLPPDAVFDIVTDPENKRVFKNIKEVISRKVVVDEGLRQLVEVEQAAIWRFLWFTGILSVHVLVDQNRQDYTMKFKQLKSGFMEKFEGSWKMEPLFVDQDLCDPLKPKSLTEYEVCTRGKGRVGTRLRLEQLIQPAFVPPPPVSWYLRGITTKTTEMLINDLVDETGRLRATWNRGTSVQSNDYEELVGTETSDIKERWRMRRSKRRNNFSK